MYYFEGDPLQQVYEDLYKDKRPTHFDDVLALKGNLSEAFINTIHVLPLNQTQRNKKLSEQTYGEYLRSRRL